MTCLECALAVRIEPHKTTREIRLAFCGHMATCPSCRAWFEQLQRVAAESEIGLSLEQSAEQAALREADLRSIRP